MPSGSLREEAAASSMCLVSTMIRLALPNREAGRLEQAFVHATDRKLRDGLRIVRLARQGGAHLDIAADPGERRAEGTEMPSRGHQTDGREAQVAGISIRSI
jgi:hypothetical protein